MLTMLVPSGDTSPRVPCLIGSYATVYSATYVL